MTPIFRHACIRSAALPGSEPATARSLILVSPSPRIAPRFVRTHEAGSFLGLSGRTMEKHRCLGTGPIFRKLGGRVVYAIEDLEAWAADRARNSTSDPGQRPPSRDTVPPRPAPARSR